ncbi:MAG: 2-oxoacid:acceptor oxidoreductase family protein [Candidatus Thermoplasmatota archaeon]|nr:2-oxoacid:acceptor oxidoreductase family protein [Candidatus Thermoplasmatota archaeon]
MLEVRFHGRGGQGAATAANILADACFREGKHVQSFPYFGVERRGAPVTAYTRIDDKPIRIKSQIYEPDCVVVLDQALFGTTNVTEGLLKGGLLLINTNKSCEELRKSLAQNIRLAVINATEIALEYNLGTRVAPIVNTAIVGAFAKVSEIVKLESVLEAIKEIAPSKKEENANAARDAYERVKFYTI